MDHAPNYEWIETGVGVPIKAWIRGVSMEDEARDILRSALSSEAARPRNLVESIRTRLAPLGGIDLPVVAREPIRDIPPFDE